MAATRHGELEPFDVDNPDDWPSYAERIEAYFVCNEITDEDKKRAHLITMIGPKCYKLLKALLSPEQPSSKSLADIMSALRNHFQPTRIEIAERFHFYRRVQKESESVVDFLAALRKLAETCEFGNYLDTALRDQFVLGLRILNIQKNLLKERGLTLARAVDLASAADAVERDIRKLKPNSSDSTTVNKVIPNKKKGWNKGKSREPGNPPKNSGKVQQSGTGPHCHRCGNPSHMAPNCPYQNATCRSCNKTGHLEKMCRQGKPFPSSKSRYAAFGTNRVENQGFATYSGAAYFPPDNRDAIIRTTGSYSNPHGTPKNPQDPYGIYTIRGTREPLTAPVEINGVPVNMEIDTGAGLSIMSESEWNRKFPSNALRPTCVKLQDYNLQEIRAIGESKVLVCYGGKQHQLVLTVVSGNRPALFGRDWLSEIKLDWAAVLNSLAGQWVPNRVGKISGCLPQGKNDPGVHDLLKEFSDVFSPELGCWKGPPAKLRVKPDFVPKFFKHRPIPFAIQGKVEHSLEKMVKEGVLEPVEHSESAAPIVPVRKPNGDIRVCGDFKVTVNPYLIVDKYPTPRNEEVFSALAGGEQFSVLDFSQAFLQIPIDEESQNLLVINTHKGLFRYKRLPFGVSPAPAILQRRMDALVKGIDSCAARADDIIVTGRNRAEHLANFRKILERLRACNLKLNSEKCQIFQTSVTYLGHVVDKNGNHPSPDVVKAIVEMPAPKNVAEVHTLTGLIQYYGEYIPNLASLESPFNQLKRKGVPFVWDQACQNSFDRIKQMLSSGAVRSHFDPNLPIIVQCDASPVGVAAVLSHIMPDGSERMITAVSRTLKPAEQNYAQIEREGLAIVFGVTRLHQYTYGRPFILRTDHRPLVHIFNPTKGISATAAGRLQRWQYKLHGYDYTIEHVPGKLNGNADAFSRLPSPEQSPLPEYERYSVLAVFRSESPLPFDFTLLAAETAKDPVLSKCLQKSVNGWPEKLGKTDQCLAPYFSRRWDISAEDGCLLLGPRLIIPLSLRQRVMEELHTGHPGMTRMKMLARSTIWWPALNSEIESFCKRCEGCNLTANVARDPSRQNKWPAPKSSWERIHLDFAGPVKGKYLLILVDAYSNWPEVAYMANPTTESTIKFLRSVFCREGLPQTLVTDNGTPFTSAEFEHFCRENGIHHICTAPFHPSSNGEAERMVQTVKNALKAMASEPGDDQIRIQRFLFGYRNTPNAISGKSPAEIHRGKKLRSRLDQLAPRPRPIPMGNQVPNQQFQAGDQVWVRGLGGIPHKWLPGQVVSKESTWIYVVSVNGATYRRHVSHLRSRFDRGRTNVGNGNADDWDIIPQLDPGAPRNPPPVAPPPAPMMNPPGDPLPRRNRRIPDRFQAGFT